MDYTTMGKLTCPNPKSIMRIANFKRQPFYHCYYSLLLFAILALILMQPIILANSWDPYNVMGVSRGSSLEDIKRSYRALARKLHPDKSNLSEDDAGKKFIELNKAYNILKDPEKRSRYDQFGDTEDERPSRSRNHHYQPNARTYQQYTFHDGYRTFTFHTSNDSYLRKKSITTKQFYNQYIEESKTKVFYIFFYSDFCLSCKRIENTWSKIVDELAKYNIGSFTINVQQEPKLSKDLYINSIPHIACLMDGQVKFYHHTELSLSSIAKFTRNLLPTNLITLLKSEEEQDRFIALGPQQYNKLSAIIVHHDTINLKLRYLLLAYELRSSYNFAQITTKTCNYKTIASKFDLSLDLPIKMNYLLIFNEDIKQPIYKLSFKNFDSFDVNQVKRQLMEWPFLKLPKLSSQEKFDDLCSYTIPRDNLKTTARLCIILFTKDQPSSLITRAKLVDFIESNKMNRDERVVFGFIDPVKQKEFVNHLLVESGDKYPFNGKTDDAVDSSILLIERQQHNAQKALHRWLRNRWNQKLPDELDRAKLELYDLVMNYKRGSSTIKDRIVLSSLADEYGPSLVDRIFWRLIDFMMQMINYVSYGDLLSTVVVLAICILITIFLLRESPTSRPPFMPNDDFLRKENRTSEDLDNNQSYQSRFAPTYSERPRNVNNETNPETSTSTPTKVDDLRIIELKAETYNGMIRLLKPGYRSIVLLVDKESKDKLLVEFKKAVWPYRRNKTLLFGYLCLDKNLEWYRALLQEVLGINELNVNKKNCIGTVLSLNGFKKYFRVYHAKHHEIDFYDDETDNDGSFLCFDDGDDNDLDNATVECGRKVLRDNGHCSDNKQDTIYTVDNLLDRLPIWLDKMFDGLTKRYCLEKWPEEIR